jgi:signal peptidase I
MKISQSSIFAGLSTLLFLLIFWMTLAPTQLGGPVTYAIVDGNSMEPGFHRGDLVLVRAEPVYGAGDAVVYRDPNLGSYVFHRILRMELDRYILQGDNNSWLDSYHPNREEIAGKLWMHIPKLGRAIEWMRVPLHTSLIAGFLGAILMFDMIPTPSQKKKKKSPPAGNFAGAPEAVLYGFGFLALLFLAAAIYAFTRPLNQPVGNIPYKQEGQFVYSATGTPGVYDTEVVRAGEPVFPKLTCFLNIGYTHTIRGEGLQGISGSHRMYARILDEQSGWQRTIPLNADAPFSGSTFFTTAALDLCQVESLVNLVEQQAGLKQNFYTLEIVTEAVFTANAGGREVGDSFSPALVFKYNKVNFYLSPTQAQPDPLYSSKEGLAGSVAQKPNTISLLGFAIPVWIVRFISLLGFGLSLYGSTAAGISLYRAASRSQEALIRLKYGSMLVDVYEQNVAPTSPVIDVAAMDDLARLAERHGTMILHMTRNFLHYYFVQNGGVTYRYVITAGRKGVPEPEPPAQPIESLPEQSNDIPAPAPMPAPSALEATNPNPIRQENRTVYVYMPPREHIQPVPPVRREAPPAPARRDPVEYVIQTGEIEFAKPPQSERMLRRIKL